MAAYVDLTIDEDPNANSTLLRMNDDASLALALQLQSEEWTAMTMTALTAMTGGGDKKRSRGSDSIIMLGSESKESPPQVTLFTLELSKSSRAVCAVCNEKIPKDVVRCSVQYPNALFSSWQHLKCTIFDKSITRAEDISGFDLLEKEEHRNEAINQLIESADKADEANNPIDPNELVRKDWKTALEPPATLLMPLLPYQKEGLGWMVYQEDSNFRGGILADGECPYFTPSDTSSNSNRLSLSCPSNRNGNGQDDSDYCIASP